MSIDYKLIIFTEGSLTQLLLNHLNSILKLPTAKLNVHFLNKGATLIWIQLLLLFSLWYVVVTYGLRVMVQTSTNSPGAADLNQEHPEKQVVLQKEHLSVIARY